MNKEENEYLTKLYDLILEYEITTKEALDLAIYLCGYSETTLNNIIYIQTGYEDIHQYIEYELF